MTATSTKTHVLSDVDGTITKGSLVLDHAVMLHETGVINLGGLAAAWKRDMKNEALISELADGYRQHIVGKTNDELKVDSFIHSVERGGNFYSVLKRLVDARQTGADVTLISGSPNFLISRFAERFNFNGVGSEYYTDEAGRYTGDIKPMFHADAKRDHVAGMDLEGSVIHAYGDTRSDVPLFEVADWSVLVHPTKETHDALSGSVNEVIYA